MKRLGCRLRLRGWRGRVIILAASCLALAPALMAQRGESALGDAEVEQLREAAPTPPERLSLFIKFLDTRSGTIADLVSHPRKPGRERTLHDLMEQFTSIADDLNDNLDDYGPRHKDIRKVLPKLLQATERWASQLKQPSEDATYEVSRKLALEAVKDIRDEATRLLDDQKAWFVAHPPAKDKERPVDNHR